MATAHAADSKPKSRAAIKAFDAPATTRTIPSTSLDDSSQIVTIPAIPELFNENFLDVLLPPVPAKAPAAPTPAPAPPTNSFMTALLNDAGNQMLTDNGAAAYQSTLDPALDLFSTAADADGTTVYKLLSKSWEANPNTTLRLIFCLRSIHDGKSEKTTFYHAFGWLFKNHPRTAIANLPLLVEPVIDRPSKKSRNAEEGGEKAMTMDETDDWTEVEDEKAPELRLPGYSHGYYKDLLNILVLAVSDQLTNRLSSFTALTTERPWWTHEDGKGRKEASRAARAPDSAWPSTPSTPRKALAGSRSRQSSNTANASYQTKREKRAARTTLPETPAEIKAKASQAQHERLVRKLTTSVEFRALYVAVARIFGTKLAEELETLKKLDDGVNASTLSDDERLELIWKIGLVGKWAPTLHGSHDRSTNIATAIALVLQSKGVMSALPVPFNASAPLGAADASKVRGFYRRWVVSPLRRYIQVPETYFRPEHWKKINYNRVPAVCMRENKKLFFKHDTERFKKYLEDVAKGKRSIAGATLLPHQLVGEAISLANEGDADDAETQMNLQVVEGQWNALVDRLKEAGALGNCMALCDVSGSMGSVYSAYGRKLKDKYNQPIFPAVALSLLVSQLAKPPFANTFIIFSMTPDIVTIDPTQGLVTTVKRMVASDWGMNTDFLAVFNKLILPLAIKHRIPKEDMIKRLFVFSDMQFDASRAASRTDWKTDFKQVSDAYRAAGYDVPEIVFWNLSQNTDASKPVLGDTEGVALLSGFSGNLLKIFMESDEDDLLKQLESFTVVDEKGEEAPPAAAGGMTPLDVMMKALSKKSFDGLRVID